MIAGSNYSIDNIITTKIITFHTHTYKYTKIKYIELKTIS